MVLHTYVSKGTRRMANSARQAYDFLNSKRFEEGVRVGHRFIKGASTLTEMLGETQTVNRSPQAKRYYEATSDVLSAYKDNFPEKWQSNTDDTAGIEGLGTMLNHADRLSTMVDTYRRATTSTPVRSSARDRSHLPANTRPGTTQPWQTPSGLFQEALD